MNKRGEVAIGIVALIALSFYLVGCFTAHKQDKEDLRDYTGDMAKK